MFHKIFTIFVFLLIGLVIALIIAWPEEFSEKLVPLFMVGTVVVYLLLSWFLGYFIGSQRPPLMLMYIGFGGLIIAFISGFFIGNR